MIFEMTLDYNVVLPVTITVALSNGIRWYLSKETIYTLKLARRGHFMPEALQTNFYYLQRAHDIMEKGPRVLGASTPLADFARMTAGDPQASYSVVEEQGRVLGFIAKDAALRLLNDSGKTLVLKDLVEKNFVTVEESSTFQDILSRMRTERSQIALVVATLPPRSPADVLGLITREHIAASVERALDLFA
jgi:chloride channel protein, CIC family